MRFEAKEIFAVLLPYFGVVSVAYLWGYWGGFNINILQFIDFHEIVKLSIYPILIWFSSLLVGMVFSELLVSPKIESGAGNDSAIGKFGLRYGRQILACFAVLAILMVVLIKSYIKWYFVAFVISLFSIPLQRSEWLKTRVSYQFRRWLFLLFFLPGMAFAWGRTDSIRVKNNYLCQVVDIHRSDLGLDADAEHPVCLLGFVGGFYIFYEAKTGEWFTFQKPIKFFCISSLKSYS